MTDREMTATAKRLVTVEEGLREMEEGAELAIGQLTFLGEMETKKRNGVAVCIEYRDLKACLDGDIAYLRCELNGWQSRVIKDLAQSSDKNVTELERAPVLDEANDILKSIGGK